MFGKQGSNDPLKNPFTVSIEFLNLTIDSDIIDFVRENKDIFSNEKITTRFITEEINRAFESDSEKTISYIDDFDIFKIIPLSGAYSKYLVKNKLLSKYLS